jgi:hypothetical protein
MRRDTTSSGTDSVDKTDGSTIRQLDEDVFSSPEW